MIEVNFSAVGDDQTREKIQVRMSSCSCWGVLVAKPNKRKWIDQWSSERLGRVLELSRCQVTLRRRVDLSRKSRRHPAPHNRSDVPQAPKCYLRIHSHAI